MSCSISVRTSGRLAYTMISHLCLLLQLGHLADDVTPQDCDVRPFGIFECRGDNVQARETRAPAATGRTQSSGRPSESHRAKPRSPSAQWPRSVTSLWRVITLRSSP